MLLLMMPVAVTLLVVEIGTVTPEKTRADWLSSVMSCGRLSTSRRPCVLRARTSRLNVLLDAENTKPLTPGVIEEVRPTPRLLNPWKPTWPGLTAGLFPSGRLGLLKLNPGRP